jgi:23S rRNA (pseudouridine1915-N3)-methyltransferase
VKFRLLWLGSNADAEFAGAIERYCSRIKHFFPIEIIEIEGPKRGRQSERDRSIIRDHSTRLVSAIPPRGYTVVLDERGRSMDSLKFAKWLERLTTNQPHGVTFVLGGDVGFDDSVRQRGDELLSLSAMTLPHQMARVILLEQIYRACTLMRNIPYHK